MPAEPKLVLDEDVMRYALAASASQRRKLVAQLTHLQSHAFDPPDFREQDRTGRWLSVKALRPFLIILPRSMKFHFEKNWKLRVSREWRSSVVEFRVLRQSSIAWRNSVKVG